MQRVDEDGNLSNLAFNLMDFPLSDKDVSTLSEISDFNTIDDVFEYTVEVVNANANIIALKHDTSGRYLRVNDYDFQFETALNALGALYAGATSIPSSASQNYYFEIIC